MQSNLKITKNEPGNWKHDGIILVNSNDDKIRLTNLADGQKVKIVNERGRIEMFKRDNSSFPSSIQVNHIPTYPFGSRMADYPYGIVLEYAGILNGKPWYKSDLHRTSGGQSGGTIAWSINSSAVNTGKWQLITSDDPNDFRGNVVFSSDEDVDTPDLCSSWDGNPLLVGGQTGLSSDMVISSPELTASNWSAIKNTVYLTIDPNQGKGGFAMDDKFVNANDTAGFGWVPVGQQISHYGGGKLFKVEKVNGVQSHANEQFYLPSNGSTITIPDSFPVGALLDVKIFNA